jgi:hypothetical protein|tara:strand:- start:2107 stop:2649 length:543 start_codon:yes stop_codon:yes gene_type:complete
MKEYILEVKKVISHPFCKKIINCFDHNYNDAGTVGGVNKNVRNCVTRSVMNPETFGERICSNFIQEKIFNCVEHYQQKHKVKSEKISQLDLLKYETNDSDAGYVFHTDFGLKVSERQLSISICLNNQYEGGEFVFETPDGPHTIPQNEGDAVIFPSNFMFRHQVNKVTAGTRYALIGWVI